MAGKPHKKTNKKPVAIPMGKPDHKPPPRVRKALPGPLNLTLILGLVVIGAFLVYEPSLHNGFTNWDDPGYLTMNYDIRNWSAQSIRHLFDIHTFYMGNYHPLTMLSLAFEYHLHGLNAFFYHRDSLIIHILTSLAVTTLAWLLTRNPALVSFTGLVFVLHPMHVESVAWVAGRKDVLMGLFYFLALIAWYYYVKTDKNKGFYYALCAFFFILSLLSKAMAVTLPVSCLLLDYYLQRPLKWRLILEKMPLFALSIAFGLLSIKAQQSFHAVQTSVQYPFFDRIFYASYAFLAYIVKFIIPVHLSNYYPYPVKTGDYLPGIWYIYPIIVLALVYLLFRFGRKYKPLVFGFLFFASAIFLLLQLLPVGDAIIADRYTYIAYFGLIFCTATLFKNDAISGSQLLKNLKPALIVVAFAFVAFLGTQARSRTEVWKSTETLWKDEINKQPDEPKACNNLAFEYQTQGRYDEALPLYARAIALQPDFYRPYCNRGDLYWKQGKYREALNDLNKGIALKPDEGGTYLSRAIVYSILGKTDSAGPDFNKAIALNPTLAEAYAGRGNYNDMTGHYEAALADYAKAIALKPDLADAYLDRGEVKIRHNDLPGGMEDLNRYLELNPASADGYLKRSSAWSAQKEYQKALDDALEARRLGAEVDKNYLDNLKKATGK